MTGGPPPPTAMPVTTSGTDARFSTLLEPIRDLAENWSIDIASELEEYLGEPEATLIDFVCDCLARRANPYFRRSSP